MSKLRSYPKVWNLGHRAIRDLFEGPVVIQEKVDGSQFSFGVVDGVLECRSKGAQIHLPTKDKLFKGACETAQRLFDDGILVEDWIYRGEALYGPKHNSLTYERAPNGNIILFDVDTGLEDRVADPEGLAQIGLALGLEVVPTLYVGPVANAEELKVFLDTESILGNVKVEGVVIKNYDRFGEDGKMLMGKIVSEAFREVHAGEWKKSNPGKTDILGAIKDQYRSTARWEKAIQHGHEEGILTDTPSDIGPLLAVIQQDIKEECEDEIKDLLFKAFWKQIGRGAIAGFPEWYKARLTELQFLEGR
ncbi:MAG: RNA ligase family protein [Nitrospiraceae bacterium]